MPIYVEILIRADIDEIWKYTQTPELHNLWDLRFTSIEYLPRLNESRPQQFLYSTRIGFGMTINGQGESVGSRENATGCRTSVLKFWSIDPRSLILEGSGYWQYVTTDQGVRFLTQYNYKTRFGLPGMWIDRLVFRPMLGWATAWSFDRLRMWLERGVDPAAALERSIVYAFARTTLAIIWIYQGLIPKLLFPDSGELAILRHAGIFHDRAPLALTIVGLTEMLFGILLPARWNSQRLLVLNIALMIALGAVAFISQPLICIAPFNPVTLNLAMIALSVIGLVAAHDLPTARTCKRTPPAKTL